MKNVIVPRQEVGGGSPRSLVSRGLSSVRARRVFRRVFPWVPARTRMDGGQDKSSADPRGMTGLAAQLHQYQKEEKQFRSEQPLALGTGVIAEIVPPIAGEPVRSSVGSPSMAGYLVSGDAWQIVLSRFLKENSKVLDIGCGCGKMARNLSYHPYIKQRSARGLEPRRFLIAPLEVGQEYRAVLLRACLPHDLATIQCLPLALWFVRRAIGQQVVHRERLRMEGVCIQCVH